MKKKKQTVKKEKTYTTDEVYELFKIPRTRKSLMTFAKEDFKFALAGYRKNPKDFHAAWHFLYCHPAFMQILYLGDSKEAYPNRAFLSEAVYIEVVKVDPVTKRIEDDESRNTMTNVWLEAGPWYSKEEMDRLTGYPDSPADGTCTHDINIDCGGDTFEEAIIEMARLVMKHYGVSRPPFHDKKKKKK